MRKVGAWFMSGMLLLFGLGVLNRLLNDKRSPGMIGGFLNSLSNLFQSTINS